MRAATLLAAVLAMPVYAQQWHLQAHTVSHHFHERTNGREWNGTNLGLGLRREFSPGWSVQAGAYRNSIERTSAYAITDWTPLQIGPARVGVFAGIRTGYTQTVQPAGGALLRLDRVTLRLAPKSGTTGSAVVTLEIGFPIK